MAYVAPPFTPTVTISGTDLIRNTDEKLQTIANDVGDYLEAQSQAMYTDLDGQMTVIENDYNTVLKPEIEQKMDDLLGVNPDGTYYTKSAIDALVASKVAKVTSTDNAIARFDGTTGAIQNSGVVVDDIGNTSFLSSSSALAISPVVGGNTTIYNWLDASSLDVWSGVSQKTGIHINGQAASGGSYISFRTGNAETLRLDRYGNLGLGVTPSGVAKLQVAGGLKLNNAANTDATTLDWYEEGTATLTATGMTTSPTGTGRFTRNGDTVTMIIPALTGTSNATTFTLTGIPTNFRPAGTRYGVCRVQDNGGLYVFGTVYISPSGVANLTTSASVGAFTASGTKAVAEMQITYHI